MSLPTPLINRSRAQQVMQQAGVSAMVLADPTNIYYATGFWPQTVIMGNVGSSVAVVPADAAQPVTLVTAQFLHYFFDIDDVPPGSPLQILLYTAPDQDGENAMPPIFFRSAADGTEDVYERATRATTLAQLEAHPAYVDAGQAVRSVLGGLGEGAIATDNVVSSLLAGLGAGAARPAGPLLRRTRMIKSVHEIGLMRIAAQSNCEAFQAALATVGIGSTYVDLQNAFFAETGRRGGKPVFISTDHVPYRQRRKVITEGRAFSIDAVATYSGYHGDYGRTILVGTPTAAVMQAVEGAIACNAAVARNLGPGLRYSDISRIGQEAVAKAGFDITTPSSPHSVGLFHTDEAFKDDGLVFAKADHLIEEGMVLSVDCPMLQTDMGGTVHLEDLWLITANGCEPLNDTAHPYYQL
ncbi:MAG TPA: M24 family metallopeptidase [Novosphingobium sp.]|nr:M24 family metallopeptidase [Novosphingobium sp.]